MIEETKKVEVEKCNCPDCNMPVNFLYELNTDWYGMLKYFKCRSCKETFVLRDSGNIAIAARR